MTAHALWVGSSWCFTPVPVSVCIPQIVPTYERMVIFRLGRLRAPQGPGVVLLLPFIDHWQRVDLRTRAFNVPPCKVSHP